MSETMLVTGACGFIGSHFVRMLNQIDYDGSIVVLDKLTYAGNQENLEGIPEGRYDLCVGDISDINFVDEVFKRYHPTRVVNFAAETHVDRSIDSSTEFTMTNFIGVQILLDACLKYKTDRFLQVSCYDEKTRALTKDGLKTYDQIKEGDVVFSINPKTKEIEEKPVDEVIIQDYEGDMVRFLNKRVDILVTPNHRMFIETGKKSKIKVEEAETASKRSVFKMPAGLWKGTGDDTIELEGIGCVPTRAFMYFLGIFIGDGHTSYQEKQVSNKSSLNRVDFLKESRSKKNGRFVSTRTGSVVDSTCRSFRIFIDIPESDECRCRVEAALKELGICFSSESGASGQHIYFTSKKWMEFLDKHCGKGARGKCIPRWIFQYSPLYLKKLFEGLMDSDGHKLKSYSTVSDVLLRDMCELCFKIGRFPRFGKKHSLSHLRGRKIEGDSYYLLPGVTQKSISKGKMQKEHYSGKVWCLKVRDNSNFIVERNGRLDFCGNTDEVYGDVGGNRRASRETDVLAPSSPYSASKAAADLLALSYVRTHKMDVVITRCTNNYGSYQYPEKLIPLVITKILKGEKVPVYGLGDNVRDWICVSDHCSGILSAFMNGDTGEIYNFSSGELKTNLEVVRKILEVLGKNESCIEYVEDRKGHDKKYWMSYAKAKRDLNWSPVIEFEQGIVETVEWYKKRKEK